MGIAYWSMPTITLAHSLFFLSNSFFLSKFPIFSLIFHPFSYLFFSCFISRVFLPPSSVLLLFFPLLCTTKALFYIACYNEFLMFYLLIAFVLVQVSFPDHPLVYRLPSHHHLPMLVVPHSIPRQNSFILFSCSPLYSHSNKGRHSLLLTLIACTQ